MKQFKLFALLTALVAGLLGCNPEPEESSVEFASRTYGYTEGQVYGYVALIALNTPEQWPIVVDVKATYKQDKDEQGKDDQGKDDQGKTQTLKSIIAFDRGEEESYNVSYPDDNTAIISGVEVTYSEYNKKIYFSIIDNDFLQSETSIIKFEIISATGATNIGDYSSCELTIVDDEYAPRIKTPYYQTEYEPLDGATNPNKGKFFLRLDKVGKYRYVASNLFGLPRPRLLGMFDPEKQTLTFTHTDYDHTLWFKEEEYRVSPFQNDTIWYYNKEKTQVLRLFAGEDGDGPLVLKTEKIDENKSGAIVEFATRCGWAIYNFDGTKATDFVGYYDGFNTTTKMTYFETNYDEDEFEQTATRSNNTLQYGPIPFAE